MTERRFVRVRHYPAWAFVEFGYRWSRCWEGTLKDVIERIDYGADDPYEGTGIRWWHRIIMGVGDVANAIGTRLYF